MAVVEVEGGWPGGEGSVGSNNTTGLFNTSYRAVVMTTLTTCCCSTPCLEKFIGKLLCLVLIVTTCTEAQACSRMSILFYSSQSDGCLLFVIVHAGQYLYAGGKPDTAIGHGKMSVSTDR